MQIATKPPIEIAHARVLFCRRCTVKIDWFSVISDLERTGMTQREIADYIGVSKSTVNSWKQYNEPRYGSGAALLDLWKVKTKGQEIER
ncbi:helix-turn-helix domain-containing protein [Salmonella enterica]|nr:helix-turn-helix domain-containing protein [Salmonella enterica]